jgi:SAM-dependent methyltransferase
VIGYKNPAKYWDERWRLNIEPQNETEYRAGLSLQISSILFENECQTVLEIGCGQAWLRSLPGYLGLDFSVEVLKQSMLSSFLYADVTKQIPLPSKSFDAAVSLSVLMHVPKKSIEKAVAEISRVTRKCVVLRESFKPGGFHCFCHDYEQLFRKYFDGKLCLLDKPSASCDIDFQKHKDLLLQDFGITVQEGPLRVRRA